MKWSVPKIFPPKTRRGKKSARPGRAGAGSMIVSFDGRIVRLYLPEA
jgi:hypothetical protein